MYVNATTVCWASPPSNRQLVLSARSYGSERATAVCSTPGSCAMRERLLLKSPFTAAELRYRASCNDIVAVVTFVSSTPDFTVTRRVNDRISTLAPTTRTMQRATWDMTSRREGQRRDRPATEPPDSRSVPLRSVRLA